MFKLFRRYQMYLLAIMGTLLMGVFLVQGTLTSLFEPNRGTQAIGTIDGRKITVAEEQAANIDLNTLKDFSPLLVAEERNGDQNALRWLLMLHDAKAMGLDASNEEVARIQDKLGLSGDEAQRAQRAREIGVSLAMIDRAVRDWAIIQQYKELVLGLAHMSAEDRINSYEMAMMQLQFDARNGRTADDVDQVLGRAIAGARGTMRVSGPLLEHLLLETFARVRISAATVPADRYLSKIGPISSDEVTSLFEKYRDHLPGQVDADGYTLGYKTPDRVKIEYLAIPLGRLRDSIKLDETEILSYYEAHRNDPDLQPPSASTQPAAAPAIPDDAMRAKIISMLTMQRANDQAQRAVKIAQAMLSDETRSFKENDGGYRILPAGWQPMSLEWVAGQIQKQIGVLPDVHRLGDRWLDMAQLSQLRGIGQAMVDGTRGVMLAQYVQTAQEFSPKADNPLAVLHLQAEMPSQPMTGMDGSRYLFRLIAAEPARVPESIDEPGVRTQVTRDAKRLAAYKLLLQDRAHWQHEAEVHPLASLAQQLGSPVLTPPAFPRRELDQAGPVVPDVEGIGPDRDFVDSVFSLAEKVALRGPIEVVAPAQRSEAVPSNADLALFLVRIDAFEALPRSTFDRLAVSPGLSPLIQNILTAGRVSDSDALSLDSLEKRVGFVPALAKGKDDTTPSPGGSGPAETPLGG